MAPIGLTHSNAGSPIKTDSSSASASTVTQVTGNPEEVLAPGLAMQKARKSVTRFTGQTQEHQTRPPRIMKTPKTSDAPRSTSNLKDVPGQQDLKRREGIGERHLAENLRCTEVSAQQRETEQRPAPMQRAEEQQQDADLNDPAQNQIAPTPEPSCRCAIHRVAESRLGAERQEMRDTAGAVSRVSASLRIV
jgi:hypothetical protein